MSQQGGEITIGDPLKGKQVVSRKDLMSTYRFTGFFLRVGLRTDN